MLLNSVLNSMLSDVIYPPQTAANFKKSANLSAKVLHSGTARAACYLCRKNEGRENGQSTTMKVTGKTSGVHSLYLAPD